MKRYLLIVFKHEKSISRFSVRERGWTEVHMLFGMPFPFTFFFATHQEEEEEEEINASNKAFK